MVTAQYSPAISVIKYREEKYHGAISQLLLEIIIFENLKKYPHSEAISEVMAVELPYQVDLGMTVSG